MAFRFGRGKETSSWLRVRPRVFFDWEKTEGVLTPELCNQHKQQEGTPMLLDQATPRNVSRAIKEINGFEWEGDFKPMARQALKELLENRLDQEMAQYLGVSRYKHATDRHDYRNGCPRARPPRCWLLCSERKSRPPRFRASRGVWTRRSAATTAVSSRINTAIYSSMGWS
jgi:hypothetical protein